MSHKWPCINLNPQWQTQKSVIQYILEYYFSNILNAPPSFRFISPYRAFPKLSLGWRTGDCLCSQQLSFSNTGKREISVSTDWQHASPLSFRGCSVPGWLYPVVPTSLLLTGPTAAFCTHSPEGTERLSQWVSILFLIFLSKQWI